MSFLGSGSVAQWRFTTSEGSRDMPLSCFPSKTLGLSACTSQMASSRPSLTHPMHLQRRFNIPTPHNMHLRECPSTVSCKHGEFFTEDRWTFTALGANLHVFWWKFHRFSAQICTWSGEHFTRCGAKTSEIVPKQVRICIEKREFLHRDNQYLHQKNPNFASPESC